MIILLNTILSDIIGAYHNVDNKEYKIFITDDRFYYLESNASWSNDTLAECIWTRINDQFIEIKSVEDYTYTLFSNMDFTISVDSCVKTDSIKFVFSIPYTKSDLKIVIAGLYREKFRYSLTNKREKFIYSQNNRVFMISNDLVRIEYILISPCDAVKEHDSYGRFYGIPNFVFFCDDKIPPHINDIRINIPLDNSYFEKYYIKNSEFVRVHNDTVSWKGRTFVRSE